jgi:hypothetical protein
MIGTAAVAQDATQTETTAPAAGGTTVAPGNTAPERDARGIPVVSDPATAPAGANQPVQAPPGARVVPSDNQRAAFTTQPATKEYPVCSRTVTDGCVQAYERGSRRPG